MRNPEWISLTDAQQGHLVNIWLLAADHDGEIPNDPQLIKKICFLKSPPDLELFINLGFIEDDAKATPKRRQSDNHMTHQRRSEEVRRGQKQNRSEEKERGNGKIFCEIPTKDKDKRLYLVTEGKVKELEESFPSVDVRQEIRGLRQWSIDTPEKRKTYKGIPRFLSNNISRKQSELGQGQVKPSWWAQEPVWNSREKR